MGKFFRGWRRKLGVLALVLSCIFTTGWIRSASMTDYIFIPVGKESGRVFSSTCGTLGYYEPDSPRNIHKINWHSQVTSDLDRLYFKYRKHLTIPYWSNVIPLTLLSAYLLLSKPRQSTQKKLTESKANEGT